jgi:hypothetical protein
VTPTPPASPAGRPRRVALTRPFRGLEDGYGVAFVLTIATIATLAVTGFSTGGGVLAVLLAGGTLLFSLRTSEASPRIIRVAQVVVVISVIGTALAVFLGDEEQAGLANGLLGFLLAAIVPVVIINHILHSPTITYRLVVGALVVYLLLGLSYAYVFALIGLLQGEVFFVQTALPTSAQYIYFSFTTLATVGYGDFTASTSLGQLTAISEAIFGQLYLVSIVAILVANVGRSFRDVRDE